MVGTVVNVSETCTLEPIARIGVEGALDFGRLECRADDPPASTIAEKIHGEETKSSAAASDDSRNELQDSILPSSISHFPKSQDVSYPRWDGLLYEIPGEELKRAADFEEGVEEVSEATEPDAGALVSAGDDDADTQDQKEDE